METYQVIRDKSGALVPFRMNEVQQILAQEVARCWHKEVPVRFATPKSRQQGSSTFWQLLLSAMAELKEGYRVMIVAHDETGSREVFGRTKTMLRQLEASDWAGPYMLNMQDGYYRWDHESSIQTATIRSGDALGKGMAVNAIHYSESANFSDGGVDAKGAIASITPGLAKDMWSIAVHESTAKGKDPFFWPLCEKARDPNVLSTYKLIFLPWFLTSEYSISWSQYRKEIMDSGGADPGTKFIPTTEEQQLRERLATQEVEEHEKTFRYKVRLTNAQLVWRRWAIENICGGDLDQFKRYFPSFYEEAFTASSSCMFDNETIEHYRKHASPPIHRGHMETPSPKPMFAQSNKGKIQVWQAPLGHHEYLIAADPGGEKARSDPYAGYVFAKHSLEVVAAIHGHFEWDEFADQLFELGLWYNHAYLVVENNRRSAIVKRLHRRAYPNLHYHQEVDRLRHSKALDPGFNMNRKTRPAVMAQLSRATRAPHFFVDCPDQSLWKEMENFVWVPKSSTNVTEGAYRAIGGNHDDRIIALAIGTYFLNLPNADLKATEPPGMLSPSYKFFLAKERERAKSKGQEDRLGMLNLNSLRGIDAT